MFMMMGLASLLTHSNLCAQGSVGDSGSVQTRVNATPKFLGEGAAEFLQDLLMCPDGPRVRDRIAHGELGEGPTSNGYVAGCTGLPESLRVALVAIVWRAESHHTGCSVSTLNTSHDDDDDLLRHDACREGGASAVSTRQCFESHTPSCHEPPAAVVEEDVAYFEACSRALAGYRSCYHPHALAQRAVLEFAVDIASWHDKYPPPDTEDDPLFAVVPHTSTSSTRSAEFIAVRATVGRPPRRLRDACKAATAAMRAALTSIVHVHLGNRLPDSTVPITLRVDPVCRHDDGMCALFRVESSPVTDSVLHHVEPLLCTLDNHGEVGGVVSLDGAEPSRMRTASSCIIERQAPLAERDGSSLRDGTSNSDTDSVVVDLWFAERQLALFERAGDTAGSKGAHRVCVAARRLVDAVIEKTGVIVRHSHGE